MTELYPAKPNLFKLSDFFKVVVLGLFLVAGQSALIALFGHPGYGVEWVLILAVYVTLRTPLWVTALTAFTLGFLRDAVGGGLLGLYQFTLVLLTWLFHPYRTRLNFFSPLTLIPLVFILGLGGYLFIMTPVMAVLGWPGRNFNPIPGFFFSSLFSALAAYPTFAVLNWLTKGTDKQNG